MRSHAESETEDKFVPLSHNSPFHEHVYAAWSGKETHEDQQAGCERIVAMVDAVVARGITIEAPASDVGEITFEVEFIMGGDYPWLAASQGLVGHVGACPCVWCEISAKDLGHAREQVLDAPGFVVLRTRARQCAHAHLFGVAGGRCKCGGKHERTFANDADAKMKYAALSKKAAGEFPKHHAGTYFQQG